MRKMLGMLIGNQSDMDACGAWENGEDALKELPGIRPDVVLVDMELPGISGSECIRVLSEKLPCTAFVVVTIHEDAQRVFAALRAGANGYLLKGSALADIVAGIHAAARGGAPLSPEIAGLVIREFQSAPVPRAKAPLPDLSPRETQVLELLATGMSTKEAAGELSLSYETVRDYLKQIYQKLHVRSRTEAVLKYIESS